MPLLRFRVRTVLIAIAAIAVVLTVARYWDLRRVSMGVGHVNISVTILVCDEQQRPVAGALIDLQDPDCLSTPIEPWVLARRTGSDGRVTVPLGLQFVSGQSASGRLLSFRVRYPNWRMQVSADGYEHFAAEFPDHAEADPRFHTGSSPPPIVVRVRKLGGDR